jgi:hypothetical protein
MQVQSGHTPEKAIPDEEPHIPAQEQELQDRDAYKHVPVTGEGQIPAAAWHRVPSWEINTESAVPEPQSKRVNRDKERDFDGDGITQPGGLLDCCLKARLVFFPDNSTFDKSPHNRTHAQMDNQLGPDEHWEGKSETHLHLNIIKKGKPAYSGCLQAQTSEEQQRHPCD